VGRHGTVRSRLKHARKRKPSINGSGRRDLRCCLEDGLGKLDVTASGFTNFVTMVEAVPGVLIARESVNDLLAKPHLEEFMHA